MNWRAFVLCLVAFSFIASLFAVDTPPAKATSASIQQHGATTIDEINSMGLIKLNGTSITNQLRLTGSLISQHAKLNILDIIGEANLTHTVVNGDASIMGSLQANHSTFKKPLVLFSQKARFIGSTLEAITIRQDGAYKGKQVIELQQGTIVNGRIHFESGKGEVVVFPGCQALGGVTGGKIVKK